ncbi:MAG TPA: bacteriohemerythrin [Anaeromyxobacteraceae bacterium]|nr:bacteriohemerythrin [Anaeromyxobacteraceae bacterium]
MPSARNERSSTVQDGRMGRGPGRLPAARAIDVWVPALYALVAGAWIAFSDMIAAGGARSARELAAWSLAKGLGFVFVTAIVLHVGLRRALRRAERALQERERRLRSILETALDGFWLLDESGRLLEVNEAYCGMTGYTRDELLRMGVGDLDAVETPEQTAAHIERIKRAGADRFESRHRCKDGRTIDIEASVSFVTDPPAFVCFYRDITERKRADEVLRRNEERFRALIEKSTDMMSVLDAEGRFQFWSQSAAETLGWAPEEMLGKPLADLVHVEEKEPVAQLFRRLLANPGGISRGLIRYRHKNGSWRQLEAIARNLLRDPAVKGVVVNTRDVTDQRELEERFRQAQKLESIGRLAGGIAHDFNNLLTVILSGVETLKKESAQQSRVQRDAIDEISIAGQRAADLTRQMLAFARKQVIAPVSLDLGAVVRGAEKLLRRTLGEDVHLVTRLGPGLWPVHCDRGQIEQVILNLAVNARDAMPGGGTLSIETSNAETELPASHPEMRPGSYVRLTVRDTGSGMKPEVKARLFEPFFTTKPQGKGTGLGLATVYGIVQQSEGYVVVETEEGRGTTFDLYFPRSRETAGEAPEVQVPASGGTETILVVEDDPSVREVTVRSLRSSGYHVLVASDGREAIEMALRKGPLDLLLTDVIMPGLNGRELADEVRRTRPDLRVLYMSGYTQDVISQAGVLDSGIEFLPKPFTPALLQERVRKVLDAVWHEKLATGIPDIDSQHRELLAHIAALEEAARGPNPQRALDVLRFLEGYVANHFSTEETYMRTAGYPGLDEHQRIHQAFGSEYRRRRTDFEANGPHVAHLLGLSGWLKAWLHDHVRGADTRMAEYLRSAPRA